MVSCLRYYVLRCMNAVIFFYQREMDFYCSNFQTIIDDSSVTGSMGSTTQVITNGFCSFSPTSTKGKWIFIVQTVLMSFTPIVILLLQNGDAFYQMVKEKEEILHKNELVMIYTIF